MVKILLVLILLAVVVLIVVLLRGRRSATAAPARPPTPRDPFAEVGEVAGDPRALKAGDMIEYLGRRYFVRGSVRLSEGGFGWSEHLLDPDTGSTGGSGGPGEPAAEPAVKVWLSVEEDPDLEVVWWTALADEDAEGLLPDGRKLVVDGVEYRREEHGNADYRSEGTTGLGGTGRVEYVDYEASGGRYLSFERYAAAGPWEVGTGERVPRGTMTIYPGS